MKKLLSALGFFLGLTGVLAQTSVSFAATQVKMIPTKYDLARHGYSDQAQVMQLVSQQVDVGHYREVKAQVIRNSNGSAHHVLVYLSRVGYHQMAVASFYIDASFKVISSNKNYSLQHEDIAQQPGRELTSPPKCPDASIQFIAFAPNDDDLEQKVTIDVATYAASKGLKTLSLLKEKATRQNYLDAMSCPNVVGNFYDGDADPTSITTVDGAITAVDFAHFLTGAMKYKVTNIWLACQAFNDPIKSVILDRVQAQKYAAGINNLLVGPSDNTGACAMKAAISGLPMAESFQTCYKKYDKPEDHWGFDGRGSDTFGK